MNEKPNVQAVSDKVIVRLLRPREIKTSGGIIVPETAKKMVEPQLYGEVLSVGEEVKNVSVGDIIMFHAQQGGQDIVLDEYVCRVLCYGEIYGIALKNVDKQEEIPDEELMKITSIPIKQKEKSNIVTLNK